MRKHETAVCGTARTVVWEVGKCENRRQMPFMISIYLLPDSSHSSHRFPQIFYLLKFPHGSHRFLQIFYLLKSRRFRRWRRFFTFLLFYLFTFLPLNSSFTFKSPCPQAVPSRKIWRGLWCPANLRAKRFWAPEGGYIPCPFGKGEGLGVG